ncbi:hypothetical protein PLICRDRAFT_57954 [Plicaturopsis crispa FD-325 SS-3]|uniref:Amino acid transporter n=1 Tax=Plicaturopsis crispa FD-325 SS-3 TaxID=944288 RepID=A0A0C9T4B8_PLICR|nr:hypothetical protein PLICRDRAFT_57954 [Plicaturopsis crispa FD-325 SS-3]
MAETDVVASEGLQKLGYKQEMTRSRGLFHILFTYGLAAPIATSLIGGGPVTMIWGLILVALLTLPLALSLAEICSQYPTSAGAYYWTYRLAPQRYKVILSWVNGWLTMVGVWTISLSVTFGTAQLVVSGAGIYHPDWVAEPWQTYVIFLGVTAVASFVCIFFNNILPMLDIICACWTALGTVVILVCLSAKAASGRHTAAYALGHFDASSSGWTPGWAFFVGLLAVSYTFSAIGMVASMAEEVHNPAVDLPRAIVWSTMSSGQPIGVMFELIMGTKGGGFGMVIFGIGMFCAISICCAASRATWAFSRDNALPFPRVFAKVNAHTGVPLNAFLLSTAVQLLLGLLYLGSSAAFNAFVGVAVICLGTSYALPVAVLLARGRRGVEGAPFPLGRWGGLCNAMAVLWIVFAIVIFSMPAVVPPTTTSMNYASVVFVGFATISAVWYLLSAFGFS